MTTATRLRGTGTNGFVVDELPKEGDSYDPVCVTGATGMDSYGLEMLSCWGRWYAVLCFSSGENDDRTWKVVAVIPEEQLRHITRWVLEEIL